MASRSASLRGDARPKVGIIIGGKVALIRTEIRNDHRLRYLPVSAIRIFVSSQRWMAAARGIALPFVCSLPPDPHTYVRGVQGQAGHMDARGLCWIAAACALCDHIFSSGVGAVERLQR